MNLTKEEVVDMLMAISRIDGFLRNVEGVDNIIHSVDHISDTLVSMLVKESE